MLKFQRRRIAWMKEKVEDLRPRNRLPFFSQGSNFRRSIGLLAIALETL